MPRATLSFKLPEEQEEFELAQKAGALHSFVFEFEEYLRRKYKHGRPTSDEAYKEFEEIRDWFFKLMNSNEID